MKGRSKEGERGKKEKEREEEIKRRNGRTMFGGGNYYGIIATIIVRI